MEERRPGNGAVRVLREGLNGGGKWRLFMRRDEEDTWRQKRRLLQATVGRCGTHSDC